MPIALAVAPLVGAWIEIILPCNMLFWLLVAPLVGAWIEISWKRRWVPTSMVAPLVGAWIEIALFLESWELVTGRSSCRSVDWNSVVVTGAVVLIVAPLVGAWIEMKWFLCWWKRSQVAPLVGAWIEISTAHQHHHWKRRRSSCRSVDWNWLRCQPSPFLRQSLLL